jgi:hypothetical protein
VQAEYTFLKEEPQEMSQGQKSKSQAKTTPD